jgi:DNA-directed RNA polymerase specialized sigma subunit
MSGRLGQEPTAAEIAEVTGIESEEVYSSKRSGPQALTQRACRSVLSTSSTLGVGISPTRRS